MKKSLIGLGLFFVTMMSFAMGCEHFGITITNRSGSDCQLRATSLFYGALFRGVVPTNIPSGTTSQTFYLQQDDIGAGVQLDYRCEDKVVIFYSGQNYCRFSAGDIGGWPYIGNQLVADHHEQVGSYWSGRPGQIFWNIS